MFPILIIALFALAVACLLGATVTFGGTVVCSAAAVGGMMTTAAALLVILGISTSNLGPSSGNLARVANPASAAGEAESGPDYERTADVVPGAVASHAASAGAISSYDPKADFLAAIQPAAHQLADPVGMVDTVSAALSHPPADAVQRLLAGADAVERGSDALTAEFVRTTVAVTGLSRPGALAAVEAPAGDTEAA